MKKIGFIDYFLDEWHANHYPNWITEASEGRMEVASAYGLIDSRDGLSNDEWSRKMGIRLLGSIEEVIEQSDYLIVLSPDHPEQHSRLSRLPLCSGKPTYIDKTFAPNRRTAVQLFELAEQNGTPMFSSSALRFAAEYENQHREEITAISSIGPGEFDNYAIHQVEPIVSLMGTGVERVMWIGSDRSPALLMEFEGGRQAELRHFRGDCPFAMTMSDPRDHVHQVKIESDFFASFTKKMVRFFDTGVPEVDPAETIAVITILEYGKKARQIPYQWITL